MQPSWPAAKTAVDGALAFKFRLSFLSTGSPADRSLSVGEEAKEPLFASDSGLPHLAPPSSIFPLLELGLCAPRQVEVLQLIGLESRAVRPGIVLIQPRRLLMRIDQHNLVGRACYDFLRLQAERYSRSIVRRNPVGQIGKHHNSQKDRGDNENLFHDGRNRPSQVVATHGEGHAVSDSRLIPVYYRKIQAQIQPSPICRDRQCREPFSTSASTGVNPPSSAQFVALHRISSCCPRDDAASACHPGWRLDPPVERSYRLSKRWPCAAMAACRPWSR